MTAQKTPIQARAIETYELLLSTAQDILEEQGVEALNSNTIVERAGMTPPTFYRYFSDRYALLAELGQRVSDVQNAVVEDMAEIPSSLPARLEQSRQVLKANIDVTRDFKGGYALLVSLRAIPQLRPIRLASQDKMANFLTDLYLENGFEMDRKELFARCRLTIEFGYSLIEMLFETDFRDEDIMIRQTALATAAIFDLFEE